MKNKKYIFSGLLLLLYSQLNYAGPPFNTDDPETVDYKHWEYYISSINTFHPGAWAGTSPHFEVNYGLIPDVQLHLILPINYDYFKNSGTKFGYAVTEFGIKYRFVNETQNIPQIGTFPIVEIPTIKNIEFSNGKTQVYIPIWFQKSWNKLTSYGGIGYWINPGKSNKNWIFTGWEVQYDFSKIFTFGGEVYYRSANTLNNKSSVGFNLGGFTNFSDKFHFIYSIGHSITKENYLNLYVGLLWTI